MPDLKLEQDTIIDYAPGYNPNVRALTSPAPSASVTPSPVIVPAATLQISGTQLLIGAVLLFLLLKK